MKKQMLFIVYVYILSSLISLKSQCYHPFIGQNKIWSELEYVWESTFTSNYKIEGDTVINNSTYSKVYSCFNDSLLQNWNFLMLIREDSNVKVYRYDSFNQEEYLLYDFTLEIGDLFYTGGEIGGNPLFALVEDIDSVLIDGEFRKRIIFEDWFDEFWIEGIGSSTGPFRPFENIFTSDMGWEFLCLEEDSNIIYQNPDYSECFISIVDNMNEIISQNSNLIKIYPQPSKDFVNIKILDNSVIFNEIELININSKNKYCYKLNGNQFIINLKSYSAGLYIILVKSKNKTLHEKLMIEN
jgi:hypothetical protein